MNKTARIRELRRLQMEVDRLRTELGFSPPGVILLEHRDSDTIVVEADGFGGATAAVIEGNYPVDYCTKFEKKFRTEEEAQAAAAVLVTGEGSSSTVLAS